MLKKEGRIADEDIENMDNWKHSEFNVYLGKIIDEDDTESMGCKLFGDFKSFKSNILPTAIQGI